VNQEGDFFILDLESSNGTYINGRRIEEPWLLEQGDQVVLGDTEFIFRRLSKLARRRKGAPRPPGARPTRPGPKT
jgi:pSer/pThr/pTyr-binding forkhead associated (FHA) protein